MRKLMNYPYGLTPGDAVSRQKGSVTHWGIVLAPDLVLDIVPGAAPRMVSFWAFADGAPVMAHFSPDEDRPAILTRAWQAQANPRLYDAFSNNCQHLKNYVLTGEHYSESVRNLGVAAALLSLVVLASRA